MFSTEKMIFQTSLGTAPIKTCKNGAKTQAKSIQKTAKLIILYIIWMIVNDKVTSKIQRMFLWWIYFSEAMAMDVETTNQPVFGYIYISIV